MTLLQKVFDDSEDHDQLEGSILSDHQDLCNALKALSYLASHTVGKVSQTDHDYINEYMFAVAVLNLQDFNGLYVCAISLVRY